MAAKQALFGTTRQDALGKGFVSGMHLRGTALEDVCTCDLLRPRAWQC